MLSIVYNSIVPSSKGENSKDEVFDMFLQKHTEEVDAFDDLVRAYISKAIEEGAKYVIIGAKLKAEVINKIEKTVIPSLGIMLRRLILLIRCWISTMNIVSRMIGSSV